MARIQLSFTNNLYVDVSLFSVEPGSRQELPESSLPTGSSGNYVRDFRPGTSWRIRNADTGALLDTYWMTGEARQNHLIGGYRITLHFINATSSNLLLSSVDAASREEKNEGSVAAGTQLMINAHAPVGTEWRIRDLASRAMVDRYLTTADPFQTYTITASIVPVTDPIIPTTGPVIIPTITTDFTLTNVTLDTGSITPTVTPSPPAITVEGAKNSIFNVQSFDMAVVKLEQAVRRQAGDIDDNVLRAAIYSRMMEIARSTNRSPDGQAVMDWLVAQVRRTRVEAARLALAEYDSWARDPWAYEPPAGFDFPPYILPVAQSPFWLASSPYPPVLATKSWGSLLAEIVSSNGWSPLNSPVLSGGRKIKSFENVIGFPVFGTARAYGKLYGDEKGVRIFAETTGYLTAERLPELKPGSTFLTPSDLHTLRLLGLRQLAPYSHRSLMAFANELMNRINDVSSAIPLDPEEEAVLINVIRSCSKGQLRSAIRMITSGDVLGSFIASFVLTTALQEIIAGSLMLDTKLKLRGELVAHLQQQQAASPPELTNLLYYDIRGEVAVVDHDYQPESSKEAERLMGGQEAYRCFLLATID